MKMVYFSFFLFIFVNICDLQGGNAFVADYDQTWNAIVTAEKKLLTGGTTILTPKEKLVNDTISKLKLAEIEIGYNDIEHYPAAMHFFRAKPLMEKSKVFQIIKKMPKGSLLHLHNSASVSSEFVIKNITYRDDIYMCQNFDDVYMFTGNKISASCVKPPQLVKDLRTSNGSIEKFDAWLDTLINMNVTEPELTYPYINYAWATFQNMFATVKELLAYKPVFEMYHYQLLQELYDDNVMYVEIRTSLSDLYDSSGKKYKDSAVIQIMKDVVDKFKNYNPDFFGAKIIYAKQRKIPTDTLYGYLMKFLKFRDEFPNFMAGFDLVGQEDLGNPLNTFSKVIQNFSNENINYFFHAGETNWFGTNTDLNVIDAILYKSKRVGHGFSLMKHPILWNAIKTRDIGIEVSPISNQVLKLEDDLRNHPAAFYISENIPIIICNDDPGFWGSRGLSYDFYYAYMAFAPSYSGLEFLKQLAWNSIKFSTFSNKEKIVAARIFNGQWNKFLNDVIGYEN